MFLRMVFTGLIAAALLLSPVMGTEHGPVLASPDENSPAAPAAYDCSTQSQIPLASCQALVALYNSTGGPSWTNRTGWLATTTPCSWRGITCTDQDVTYISLSNNNLNGTLPAALGNLAKLNRLYLSYNIHLSGAIPPELGNATALQYVQINSTSLSGSLPVQLGQLSNLIFLDLSSNLLSGAIPAGLAAPGSLPKLDLLNLSYNQLSGAVPPELSNLSALRTLDLSYNASLSGPLPEALTSLALMEYFYMTGTALCEPSTPAFLAWKAKLVEWQGSGKVCPAPPPVRKWTVMYYLAGDDTALSESYTGIFHRLEAASKSADVNAVALVDQLAVADSAYYEIQHGGSYTENTNYWPKNELNTGLPGTLSAFIRWAREKYPAEHYALVLDDHGSGLGGGMRDETAGKDSLTLAEMTTALTDGMQGQGKIDVLVMNACLMGMIEDAYQFRSLVNYYVASENLQNAYGSGYTAALNGIAGSSSPVDVALLFARSYVNEFKGGWTPYTMSVADLSHINGLLLMVNNLAKLLNADMTANAPKIGEVLSQVQRYDRNGDTVLDSSGNTPDTYIDLYDFARLVKETFTDTAIKDAAQGVMDGVGVYVVEEYHSGPIAWYGGKPVNVSRSHGVSVYFPNQSSSFYNAANYDFAVGANWLGVPFKAAGADELPAVDWGPMLVSYVQQVYPARPDLPLLPEPVEKATSSVLFLPLATR